MSVRVDCAPAGRLGSSVADSTERLETSGGLDSPDQRSNWSCRTQVGDGSDPSRICYAPTRILFGTWSRRWPSVLVQSATRRLHFGRGVDMMRKVRSSTIQIGQPQTTGLCN